MFKHPKQHYFLDNFAKLYSNFTIIMTGLMNVAKEIVPKPMHINLKDEEKGFSDWVCLASKS